MRRAKWGMGAAVVVGVAWLISNLFNLNVGGIGGGGDARVGLPSRPPASMPERPPAEPPLQTEPEMEPVSAEGPLDAVGSGGVVEVTIDDRDYLLWHGTGDAAELVAADADAIAAYARQAAGDETGARVRIYRRPSARAAAEERLIESLRAVGIADSEIDVPEKLVEETP